MRHSGYSVLVVVDLRMVLFLSDTYFDSGKAKCKKQAKPNKETER